MSKGDKNRTTNKRAFDENYDRIFRNAKTTQLQLTDLNWDGDLEDEEAEDCYHGIQGDTRRERKRQEKQAQNPFGLK